MVYLPELAAEDKTKIYSSFIIVKRKKERILICETCV